MPSTTRAARTGARTSMPAVLAMAIVLTAFNLRPAVTSVGAVLRDIQAGTGMSGAMAGVLTTVPVVCFGLVGLLAARVRRRLGIERSLIVGLSLLAAGLLLRAAAPSPLLVVGASVVGLTGIAVANVLIPVAVKQRFPDRVGRMTGLYTMALAVGTATAAATTVPLSGLLGGWRGALAIWALPAILATVPWVAMRGQRPPGRDVRPPTTEAPVRRSRQAWGLAVFFGLQALAAYTVMGWLPTILQDAGVTAGTAGLLLALATVVGAPISVVLPELAARRSDQRWWVVGLIVVSATAYVGLAVAPAAAPALWALLLGMGLGAFPLALVMIGLRASTDEGTAQLSSLAQGVGYLIAATGPVTVGVLHDLTGGWVVPLGVLLALLVPQLLCGLLAGKPGYVDSDADQRGEPAFARSG